MPIKNVSVEEASRLLREGYVYLDVRSEQEFDSGHVPGAVNVPLLFSKPSGMQPNPDFLSVVQRTFEKDAKLVLGCRSGGRSQRAAEMLAQAGFQILCNMQAGMAGGRDPFGRPLQGWSASGLPTETGAGTGRVYTELKG